MTVPTGLIWPVPQVYRWCGDIFDLDRVSLRLSDGMPDHNRRIAVFVVDLR